MSATPALHAVARARPPSARLVVALLAVWLVWGSTYLAMRFAVEALPPLGMAGARFVVAGALLLAIARARGDAWPTRRSWVLAVPLGALLFLVGNGLVVVAEQWIPSSLAAVVCATTPLLAAGLSAGRAVASKGNDANARGEWPSRVELAGMALGLVGVALLATRSPLAHAAGRRGAIILLAPIGWTIGSLVARAQKDARLGDAAAQMTTGGAWLLAASVALGERAPAHVAWRAVGVWAWLVVFGSVVGFSAYSWLLRNSRPAVAMSYAYVNPIVAALLGVAVGGERLGWPMVVATALIATGVMVVVVRRSR